MVKMLERQRVKQAAAGCGQETGGCIKGGGGDSEGGSTGSARRNTGQPQRFDSRGGLVGPLPDALRVCIRLSQTV